jgi:hypothetical protein
MPAYRVDRGVTVTSRRERSATRDPIQGFIGGLARFGSEPLTGLHVVTSANLTARMRW